MNIFSNIGITELLLILLLALLVVGPERLPELGRKLGQTLRDLRKAYENLTRDLGPELTSFQEATQELRESVDSVRSIPQDMLQTVIRTADLQDTIEDLKGVTDSLDQVGQTVSSAGQMIKNPLGATVDMAKQAMMPTTPAETEAEVTPEKEKEAVNTAERASTPAEPEETTTKIAPKKEPELAKTTAIDTITNALTVAELEKAEIDAAPGKENDPADSAPEEQAHE
jgi:Tat protein translocase TatB subunit